MAEIDLEDTAWSPESGLTYAEWLQSKNTATLRHGESMTYRTEHGHQVTRHADGRQDVTVNL